MAKLAAKIVPQLWYASKAKEAAVYASVQPDSRVCRRVARSSSAAGSGTATASAGRSCPRSSMIRDADPARARQVAEAMLGMVKLDVAGLKGAYESAT
jgi:predicted 3-demethylubiquinone-9 3-methyltransferase (glyoxalase superfamily)